MKIYVCDYQPSKLSDILPKLEKYFLRTELKYEMFSEEGIFIVNENKTLKMKMVKDKTENLKKYIGDWNVWVDYSEMKYELVSQIPVDVIVQPVVSFNYEIDKGSKTKLVIEGLYDASTINQITKTNKYKGFSPKDFYFLTEAKGNINDLNIKEEINEFLLLLN